MEDRKYTDVWQLYSMGRDYNQSLNPGYYNLCDTNIEFFIGNQWKGLSNSEAMSSLPKPVFNIIKRVTSLFVASLTSTASSVSFEPLANKAAVYDEYSGAMGEQQEIVEDEQSKTAAEMATSEVANLFDKLRMDYRVREALFDGAQTGDYCAHFYFDPNARPYGGQYGAYRGEIKMEMVDGVNVMFGNPNTRIVEDQPYILVIGRDMVKNLCKEYEAHHKGEEFGVDYTILPDNDTEWQAGSGGKTELIQSKKTGKALFIYKYTKKSKEVKLFNEDGSPRMENVLDENGKPIPEMYHGEPLVDAMGQPIYKQQQAVEIKTTVWVSKHTKSCDIYDPIDTGLSYYPIAWGNWENQKNCYHGRALVTGIIPNQLYINQMFALVMRHLQLQGFAKTIYDGNVIGHWSNAVGQAIPVYDMPPDKRMSDLYSTIQPADMSTQIMGCIDKAVALTKECLGATDAQLGNVRPDNTSALIALQSASQVPLENVQALKFEWVEDIGRILLDMMATYYGKRPVVRRVEQTTPITDPQTGMPGSTVQHMKVVEMYDFSQLKNLWLNVRADVGSSTYWSKIAIVQTLDNLKNAGLIDVVDYLERMPEEYIPRKEELIYKLRNQMQQAPAMPGAPQQGNVGVAKSGDIDNNEAALIGAMPVNVQNQYQHMGKVAKNAILQQAKLTNV